MNVIEEIKKNLQDEIRSTRRGKSIWSVVDRKISNRSNPSGKISGARARTWKRERSFRMKSKERLSLGGLRIEQSFFYKRTEKHGDLCRPLALGVESGKNNPESRYRGHVSRILFTCQLYYSRREPPSGLSE